MALDLLMLNFRYHVVSLVAVFLALAVGVIAGTTVINQNLVEDLRTQRNRIVGRLEGARSENDALKRELDLWDRFSRSIVPPMMRGQLRGRRVVLVLEDGVPGELADGVEEAVVDAGGSRAGRIGLSEKWRLGDQPTREQLALALGSRDTQVRALLGEAAARLAARLQVSADATAESDLLRALGRDGFVSLGDADERAFPPQGALVVLVAAGRDPPLPDADGFTVPMLRALAGTMPIAVAEALGAAASLADRVRGDDELRRDVASVDHVDTLPGKLALVAGLRELTEGRPAGHYGIRRGASAVAPTGNGP